MASMSYCMFENEAVSQCLRELEDAHENGICLKDFIASRSSEHERRAVYSLFQTCSEFVDIYTEMEEADKDA